MDKQFKITMIRINTDASAQSEFLDSWERLEQDCSMNDTDYCDYYHLLGSCNTIEGEGSTRHCTSCQCTCGEKMARHLVRRAKILAKRL